MFTEARIKGQKTNAMLSKTQHVPRIKRFVRPRAKEHILINVHKAFKG